MAAADPVGNPFANPEATNGYSPELQAYLRELAINQAIRSATLDAIGDSSALNQPAGVNLPRPGVAQPPAQAPVAPQGQAPVPTAQPTAAPQGQPFPDLDQWTQLWLSMDPAMRQQLGVGETAQRIAGGGGPSVPPAQAPATVVPQSGVAPQPQPGVPPAPQAQPSRVPALPPELQAQLATGATPGVNLGQTPPTTPEASFPWVGNEPQGGELPPEMEPGPPQNPEEAEGRKQGWKQVVQRIKNDPMLQLALFRFGTSVAQPIQPGQNQVGHVTAAMQSGLDYASAQQLQEANIEKTRAETVTESQRPDLVGAQTGQVEATTGRIEAETDRVVKMTPENIKLNEAKIQQLGASIGLDQQKIAESIARMKLGSDPRRAEAEIKLLEAQAWKARNPYASTTAAAKARADWVEQTFPLILQTDSTLIKLAKTNPEAAEAKAKLLAGERWHAAGATSQKTTAQAEAQLDVWEREYAAGNHKFATFAEFIAEQVRDPFMDTELKKELTRLWNDRFKSDATKQGLSTTPKANRPALSTFEKN